MRAVFRPSQVLHCVWALALWLVFIRAGRRGHVAQAAVRVQWSGWANERRPQRAHPPGGPVQSLQAIIESSKPLCFNSGMMDDCHIACLETASFLSPPVGVRPAGRLLLITCSTRWIANMPCPPQNAPIVAKSSLRTKTVGKILCTFSLSDTRRPMNAMVTHKTSK